MNIAINNLTKSYGTQKAVDDISFEVKTGEILGFLGPNGAGKTTTMKMITQYLVPDSGDISINGHSVATSNTKSNIGYLPEHNPLYMEMPVMDYLSFTAALQGVQKSRIPDQVKNMVMMCGLDIEKHKKISEDGEMEDIKAKIEALSTTLAVDILELDRFEVQSIADIQSNRIIFDLCKKHNWALTEMIPFETKLEDIFRNLTTN